MKISRIRVRNYKSYQDSGDIELAPGFTVVVGKNNSGKSALLQSLRFRGAGIKPHRSLLVAKGVALDPTPMINAQVLIDWSEIEFLACEAGISNIFYPVDRADIDSIANIDKCWRDLLLKKMANFAICWPLSNHKPQSERWPSHGQFVELNPNQRQSMIIQFQNPQREWKFAGITAHEENLIDVVTSALDRKIFVFDAERLNIDCSPPGSGQILWPNAGNLPTLLHEMQANPYLWSEFIRHVRDVFPQITAVTTPPSPDGGGQLTICLWQVDVATQRDDLAVRLKEAGTGVGQVLAILYIAMTRKGNVIAIDEPNSFLHPGAARKLIEILKAYSDNQYVISTHSSELIMAIKPEILHQVSWDGEVGASEIRKIDQLSINDMSELMHDLGVRLSDVFGAERVVWVEGETEAVCFPILAAHCEPPPPPGTVFVPVRATGDFDSKSADADQIWGIYRRLTKYVALVPPAIAFSFDRESRSESQISDLKRVSGNLISFLPRTLLENHFLNPRAIASIIAHECAFRNVEIDAPTSQEIVENIENLSRVERSRNKKLTWQSDHNWIQKCHGAKLLQRVFSEYHLTYSKTRHGEQICRWLLKNEPEHLDDLMDYLRSLWGQV